ncbi:MAG: AcrB/AcrD/AcrF family protein [Acidobacteria bacterium]|nr:AcrB/AcrD/AcrF family protein [Acidobacteriota bacterium]
MILPTTYWAALLLSILSMLCWGSWANTIKLAGPKWRFELFYFDYAFGVALAGVIAAYTLGEWGSDLSFSDNLMITGKRNIAYAAFAGGVFNLANMLLVGAISLAGMAVAFPVGIGLALVIGVVWNYLINPQANPVCLFSGVALVLVAIVVDAMAYSAHSKAQAQNAGTKANGSTRGIVLSLVSGVLMGSFYPIVEVSKGGDVGLGPYSVAFFFGLGVFFSTFIFNIYFMNLPVKGEPVELRKYFMGARHQHLLGVLGGILWSTGAISNFLAASAPKTVQVGPAVSYALGQGATLVSALWGLLMWKEFQGAEPKVKTLLAAMLACFVLGLGLVSVAPLFAT